jgi:ribonucleoside-triphosphate reductase
MENEAVGDNTRDVESINREIEAIRKELSEVKGTPTEIYTRIVGYYRSLNNWNKGKREEYDRRRTFAYGAGRGGEMPAEAAGNAPREAPSADAPASEARIGTPAGGHGSDAGGGSAGAGNAGAAPATGGTASAAPERVAVAERREGALVSSYAYFFRPTCPNCPAVRAVLEGAALDGDHFDVDTDEGFARAAELQIMATPTVVFFDRRGEQIGRATSPKDVQGFLAFAE